MKSYFVYILCSDKKGTLYTGVTNDLMRRIYEHKAKLVKGFTEKYSVSRLVYMEEHNDVQYALYREKAIKKWKREWKINLIQKSNPEWKDLYYEYV